MKIFVCLKVNKDIWTAICRFSHSQDVQFQEIQKTMVSGIIPIIRLADKCTNSEQVLDPVKTRAVLSDAI